MAKKSYEKKKSDLPTKSVKPFKPNELFYSSSLDRPISNIRSVCFFFVFCFVIFYYYHVLLKFLTLMKTVQTGQMPSSVVSDLGQYCLPCRFYGTLGLNGSGKLMITLNFYTRFIILITLHFAC